MSLYLCVFDGEQEMEGVEVGSYSDFNRFRSYVAGELEGGAAGSLFPALMMHSDCDGEWSADDCRRLRSELELIRTAMELRPPPSPEVGHAWGRPRNALESFLDVDGQVLVERLQAIVEVALQRGRPVLFQ